jgi:transcriptional regulator with PAS, ATPase and Fis domain
MEEKRFRSDLYYRINVVEAVIPPLRERPEDVIWLMNRFFDLFSEDREKAPLGFAPPTEQAALAHSWPGNARELRNRMERAFAFNLDAWILPQDFFPDKQQAVAATPRSLADAREAAEKQQIILTLSAHEGQIGKTAEALGISRTTLWEKMKRYGLIEN